MKRLSSIALSLILTGALAIAVAVVGVPAVTGLKIVTIDAGSMQRVLPAGSMAYIKTSAAYQVGDLITYSHNGHLVTHEVIEWAENPATAARDGLWLQAKGTENASTDAYLVNRDSVLGRVTGHIPWMGVALKTLRALPVQLFLILIVIGLWWLSTRPKPEPPERITTEYVSEWNQ